MHAPRLGASGIGLVPQVIAYKQRACEVMCNMPQHGSNRNSSGLKDSQRTRTLLMIGE